MHRLTVPALLFCTLAALAGYREAQRPRAGSLASETDLRQLAAKPFTVKDVQRIHVTGPGRTEPDYTVSRSGDSSWEIDRPFRAPASAGAVDRLVRAVTSGDGELRSADPSMFGDFHLSDATRVSVRIEDADGATLAHFAVGRSSGRVGAFVRFLGGDDGDAGGVYAVTTDLRTALGLTRTEPGDNEPEEASPKAFQDTSFPALRFEDVTDVELRTPRHTSHFEKSGRIWLTKSGGPGGRIELQADAVEKVLGQFEGGLRTAGLADPARVAEFGLDAPTHALTVTLADGGTRTVLGARSEVDGKTVHHARLDTAQEPEVVYELTSWDFDKLFPSGGSLYALSGPELIEGRIGRLVLRHDGATVELRRDLTRPDPYWEFVTPTWALRPKQAAVKQLIAQISGIRPLDWADGVDVAVFDTAPVTVAFGRPDAPDADLLTVAFGGAAPGGGRLARLFHLPERVLVVDDATVERLAPTAFSLHDPKVLTGWDDRLVTSVDVARVGDDGTTTPDYVLSSLGGDWKLHRGGPEQAVDEEKVKEYVKRVLGTTVDGLAEGDVRREVVLTLKRQIGDPVTFAVGSTPDGRRAIVLGEQAFTTTATNLAPDAAAFGATAEDHDEDDGGVEPGVANPDDGPDDGE